MPSNTDSKITKNYITIKHLNLGMVPTMAIILEACDPDHRLNQIMIRAFQAALDICDGDPRDAAIYLGINPSTMHSFVRGKRIFKYGGRQKRLSETSGDWQG
jgi:hypothetical protein